MPLKIFRIFFCLIFLQQAASAQQQKVGVNNGIDRPKLIVGLVIDQMRWDYLYRYFHRYGEGGFKRLVKKGYNFDNTFIPYTPAVTGAGHACIYTGSVGAIHGIVGNAWIERKRRFIHVLRAG